MSDIAEIDCVFFDIGGTLGERNAATGEFRAYPSSAPLLRAMRERLGLRVGVITTLGADLDDDDGWALLRGAGLDAYLERVIFVSDHNDVGVSKPDPAIYALAARRAGLPTGRCPFVGENFIEVVGALTAGMKAILKPFPPGRELPA